MKPRQNPTTTLLEALKRIEHAPGMFFAHLNIDSLYNFLLGWDYASNTTWCKEYIAHISMLKRTGSRVPMPEDISWTEALGELIRFVEKNDT